MRKLSKSRRSQVTIFIIIGIIIVVAIAMIFIALRKPADYISPKENPKAYIQKCARDATSNAEKAIIPHGGIETPALSVKFDNLDVMLMCYTPETMQLCVNKHPLLNLEIEKEIKRIIEPEINKCFEDVKAELTKNNYKEEPLSLEIVILPMQISINLTKEISYSQNGQTLILKNFNTKTTSSIYDFIRITNQIVNEEVRCDCANEACNADIYNLNKYNQDFEVTKPAYSGNGEEVYSIKEILSNKIFNLAVRNCVRLP